MTTRGELSDMKTKWKNPEIIVLSKELEEPVKELTMQELMITTLEKARKELEKTRTALENAQVQHDAMKAVVETLEKQYSTVLK